MSNVCSKRKRHGRCDRRKPGLLEQIDPKEETEDMFGTNQRQRLSTRTSCSIIILYVIRRCSRKMWDHPSKKLKQIWTMQHGNDPKHPSESTQEHQSLDRNPVEMLSDLETETETSKGKSINLSSAGNDIFVYFFLNNWSEKSISIVSSSITSHLSIDQRRSNIDASIFL